MKVKIEIDGNRILAEKKKTILEVAKENGIEIPNLCYHRELLPNGACRLCLVEVEGEKKLVVSCSYPIEKGIKVKTSTERLTKIRKTILELIISDHPLDCMICEKSGDCLLEKYAYEYGIKPENIERGKRKKVELKDGRPFIIRDYEKCILCGRCVKVCEEIVGADAIDFGGRSFETQIISGFDESLKDGGCVFCGNCIQVCPVGALRESGAEGRGRTWEFKKIKTVCPYCGVGCGLEVSVKDNTIIKIKSSTESPVNRDWLCIKGKFGFEYVSHRERLTTPLIRKSKTQKAKFEEIGWDEALNLIAEKFSSVKRKYGPDSLAGLASAKCTNEENYLFQKFFRQIIKTNNVDHCARLCHASTIAGLARTIGSAAMSNSLEEIENVSTCILLTGTNVSETQPVTSYKIRRAVKRGAKLIVIDPRRIDIADIAYLYIQPRIGTDVMVFNAMAKIILDEKLYDEKFIKERVEGFEKYKRFMKRFPIEKLEEITNVCREDLRRAARLYATSLSSVILWSMGITQHTTGTDNVMTLSNLALLTGQIGKPGAGLSPLRGQNNVQGACDMGALVEVYPGYQKVENPETIKKFKSLWKEKSLSKRVGLSVVEMFNAVRDGNVKAMYIMGENPLLSDPDIAHVREALKRLDFLVVQDIFLTETAQYADVLLPAATSFEKEGTFTNTERRVQKLSKCIEPPGEAKPDWEIIKNLAEKFGYEWNYKNVWDVTEEITQAAPIYGGITPERILEGESLQWPCLDRNHPGTPTLHIGKFAAGKGELKCIDYKKPFELPNEEYPFILTTGRILSEFHTRSMTGRIKGIKEISGRPFCLMNKSDASVLNLKENQKVKISSRRGEISLSLRISDRVEEGVVFIPFHFEANVLTHHELDPISKIPEYKVCAVRIEKM